MTDDCDYGLQVLILSGLEAPHRAIAGLALALSAAANGTKVVVWLGMHGVVWAVRTQGRQKDVPNFVSISEQLGMLREEGVQLELCSSCVENACLLQGVGDGISELRPGFIVSGMAQIAARMTSVPTVTF